MHESGYIMTLNECTPRRGKAMMALSGLQLQEYSHLKSPPLSSVLIDKIYDIQDRVTEPSAMEGVKKSEVSNRYQGRRLKI